MDIDLNADLGEGAGADAALMGLVTSANVCCGLHAGGPALLRDTLALAARHGVTVGAHPGYDDRAHFGRRERTASTSEVFDLCAYQLGGLAAVATAVGAAVRYVKPHGALYHQACRDDGYAAGVVQAAAVFGLAVVGLPGSALEAAAGRAGLAFAAEGFADRRYQPDGSLVPRSDPDAFVHDPDEAVSQVERLIRGRGVRTVCVHGDNPEAVAFAAAVRAALASRGFALRPFA